jgi:hypothetical protein
MKKTVIVNDRMQRNYRYEITELEGKNFDKEFKPELTPMEMLEMGVFGGKYVTDCRHVSVQFAEAASACQTIDYYIYEKYAYYTYNVTNNLTGSVTQVSAHIPVGYSFYQYSC